jgi:hypothetical protein
MKTPMQEVIDRLKEERDLHGYERGLHYETAIELAEAMLEKEKEVMQEFALSSFRQIKNNMVVKSAQMIVEEQYNQTFNNKKR